MKTILKYLLSAAALPLALLGGSCSGSSNDDPGSTLSLRASKTTVVADGSDRVEFTVTSDGTNVSTSPSTVLLRTFEGRTEELPAGQNAFTCTAAGTYTFQARHEGELSNRVTVTATAAAAQSNFYTRVLGMQFTSVGCVNCPGLSTSIKAFEAARPDELVTVSLHFHMDIADPMYTAINGIYAQRFNVQGYPTYILGLRPSSTSPATFDQIAEAVSKARSQYPATCGVALETAYDASARKANIKVKVTSARAEAYRYQVFLLEDGIRYAQYGSDEAEYTHNNVLRATLANSINGDRLNDGAALTPGVEVVAERTRTLDAAWQSDNMRIAVAVLRSEDGSSWTCDNVAVCKLGASIDYKYNE